MDLSLLEKFFGFWVCFKNCYDLVFKVRLLNTQTYSYVLLTNMFTTIEVYAYMYLFSYYV